MRAQAILGPGARRSHVELLRDAGFVIDASRQFDRETDADLVVIFGGDGTIHRFLPELILCQKPVLITPGGSGNDLARALGIRSMGHAINLARAFSHDHAATRQIDIGIITDSSGIETPFCCTAGVGVDAAAAQFANHMPRWLRAHGGYLVAALNGVLANPKIGLTIETGSSAEKIKHAACLFAIANTATFGGGLPIAPDARLDDGELDCLLVDTMSRIRLAKASLALTRAAHLQLPEVHFMRQSMIRVESDRPTIVYADGEFVCDTPFSIRALPRAWRVLAAQTVASS